jgi:predicted ATPase/class 3 adenylate cyclase
MEENYSFGYWLRRQRLARDLRQADLAQQLGIAPITLRKIEADERRPSLQLLTRVAEVFGLSDEERMLLLRVARADLSPASLPLPQQAPDSHLPDDAAPDALAPDPLPPSGTLTFLFSDIEGSTRLWEQHPQGMHAALTQHDALLRTAIISHGGAVIKGTGDGVLAAFRLAEDSLAAALQAQRALHAADWGPVGVLKVRFALHTGSAEHHHGDYVGPALNRAARLLAAGHGGQILLSLATAELLHDQLPTGVHLRDLGTYQLKDLTRPEHVFQVVTSDLPADFPPLRTLDVRRHNLPAQATSLVGREREVEELSTMLAQPGVRLVTLTGPGGIGKTRLALQVAAELVEHFPDGVWFVNLAPVSEPDLVVPAVAQTLGLRQLDGRDLTATVQDALREQRLLLLLDNFEQVVAAAPVVAALLATAPSMTILVTSREALRLSGEHVVAVRPLDLPDVRELALGGSELVPQLSQYEAVRLFIERARMVRPDFVVSNANAPAVAEVCSRLDGLPLAIELAAARVRLFTPEALLSRLERRLDVLAGGPRDQPARQQTIRSAIGWSYELLSADEQALFQCLGVFVGSFGIPEVAAVGRRDEIETLDVLANLTDKSLLQQQEAPGSEPRFVMLETIRAFALEHLEQAGEAHVARERHAASFLELAERAAPQLRGANSDQWMDMLEADHDNLRAALRWYETQGNTERVVRFCVALWRFWFERGYWNEGNQVLAPMLREGTLANIPSQLQAAGLLSAGIFLARRSEFEQARVLLERSRELYRQAGAMQEEVDVLFGLSIVAHGSSDYSMAAAYLREAEQYSRAAGDRFRIGFCLGWLGYVTYVLGDVDTAQRMTEEGLAIFRDLGVRDQIGVALGDLGFQAYARGELKQAAAQLTESVDILRQSGNRYQLASSLNYLAQVVEMQGNAERALQLYQESLALRRRLGDRRGLVPVLVSMARATCALGDLGSAWEQVAEALSISRELGYQQGYSWVLQATARIAATEGDASDAALLLGADQALRAAHQIPLWPEEQKPYEEVLAQVRVALGEDAFGQAIADGRATALDEVLMLVSRLR